VSLQVADTLFLFAVVWLRVITSIEETFPDDAAFIGHLKPYIGKYAYPCALVAETGIVIIIIILYYAIHGSTPAHEHRLLTTKNTSRLHLKYKNVNTSLKACIASFR